MFLSPVFTHKEYANMLYVYGYADGNKIFAAREYKPRFSMRRIPDCEVFFDVYMTLRKTGTLPSASFKHRRRQRCRQNTKKRRNILDMVQRNF